MNQPKPEQEPSMEEILASIRRIISEDGEDGDATADAPEAEIEPEAAAPQETGDAGAADDDVLELTEIVAEQPEPEPEPEPAADLDFEEPAMDELSIEPEMQSEPPAMEEPLAHAPAEEDSLVADSTALMASAALSKLRETPADQASEGAAAMPLGDKTLEALVRELMRPMLKEWLNQNLPGIVERIVEREVSRVAERLHKD